MTKNRTGRKEPRIKEPRLLVVQDREGAGGRAPGDGRREGGQNERLGVGSHEPARGAPTTCARRPFRLGGGIGRFSLECGRRPSWSLQHAVRGEAPQGEFRQRARGAASPPRPRADRWLITMRAVIACMIRVVLFRTLRDGKDRRGEPNGWRPCDGSAGLLSRAAASGRRSDGARVVSCACGGRPSSCGERLVTTPNRAWAEEAAADWAAGRDKEGAARGAGRASWRL